MAGDGSPGRSPACDAAVRHLVGWLVVFYIEEFARKAKNLALNPHCVITTSGNGLDLIVEGEAHKVRDEATLQRVAKLYHAKYGWQVAVSSGAYTAPFGAPSAGLPPYELYQVHPTKAYGLGTEEPFGATRWRFS